MASIVSFAAVVKVILDDTTLIEGWNQLADELCVPKADYIGEERGFKNGTSSINELFQRILFSWGRRETRHGNFCTVGALCDKLRLMKCNATADTLEEQFDCTAQFNTHSCGVTQTVCTLKQKWWPEKKPLIKSFVERKLGELPLVEKLKDMLNHGELKAVISPHQACISGYGGIGKTTLAKWFANKYEDEFDHIVWVDCGEDTLGSSIDRLWDHTYTSQGAVKAIHLSDRARQCFKAFGECKALIIYDNAEEYSGKQGIQPTLPDHTTFPNIKCLITSRWAAWGSPADHAMIPQLSLETFSMDESVQFLKTNLLGVLCKAEELEDLAILLGHLPLALQIARAHANKFYSNKENGLASYIETLSKSHDSIVKGKTDVDGYNKGLLSILEGTKAQLTVDEPLAWRILCHMAYLQCDLVGVRFLASIEGIDITTALDACELLEKHSLITITSPGQEYHAIHPKDEHYISVHRLLQSSIRIMNSAERALNLKKVMSGTLAVPEDVWYKWEPFLAVQGLRGLEKEIKITTKQMYECMDLSRFIRDKKFTDAQRLLELYDGVGKYTSEYYGCWHRRLVGRAGWWKFMFGCAKCHKMLRLRALAVNGLSSYVLFLQGSYAEAVKRFSNSKVSKRTTLYSLREEYKFHDFNNLILEPPLNWDECSLDIFQHWVASVLNRLEIVKNIKPAKEICWRDIYSYSPRKLMLSRANGVTHRLDQAALDDCSYLHFEQCRVSYESCLRWLCMYPNQEFGYCNAEGVRFMKDNGCFVDEVDYHKVLPIKGEELRVSCDWRECTRINFCISEMWIRTRKLSLSGCRITTGTSTVLPNVDELYIDRPLVGRWNGMLNNLSLNSHFPNLKCLTITNTTLSLEIIPPNLEWLFMCCVVVISGGTAAKLPVVTLGLEYDSPDEIWMTASLFDVEKFTVPEVNFTAEKEYNKSQWCRELSRSIEPSKYSKITGDWNAAWNGENFPIDGICIFKGKAQL